MADVDFGSTEEPVAQKGRSYDRMKEYTAGREPCQLHINLEADMSDGTKRRRVLVVNPGAIRQWAEEKGEAGNALLEVSCLNCDGVGTIDGEACPKCNGTGKVKDSMRAFNEKVFNQLSSPSQSELDQIDNFILTWVPKNALRMLFR